MSLLRYYFMVGGDHFDADGFSEMASKCGFEFGRKRTVSNIKKLQRTDKIQTADKAICSGIRGTSGSQFSTWQTAIVDFACDRGDYLASRNLGMSTEAAQVWLVEERALLMFLKFVKKNLPVVGDFCKSDFFLLLKLVYGYDEEDDPGGGYHYSEALMGALSALDAGLSIDSEPFDLHFDRLQGTVLPGDPVV